MYTEIVAYTDGSAVVRGARKGNGGFGTYIPDLWGKRRAYSLGFKDTKTGRMEITALYYAIKAIPNDEVNVELIVYSDSEYIVKAFTEKRLEKWIANNWKTRDWHGEEQPVKNIDLWKAVLDEMNKKTLFFLTLKHIRSHQVEKEKDSAKKKLLLQNLHIRGNMIADRLADYKRHKTLLKSDKL